MPNELTTARLKEMLAVCGAATPGPLKVLPPDPAHGCEHWSVVAESEAVVADVYDSFEFQDLSSRTGHAKGNAECFALARTALSEVIRELIATREARDAEIGRWQDAIRNHVIKESQIPNADVWVDGAGCDSGDPLDVSLAEISQVINHFIDELATTKAELAAEQEARETAQAECRDALISIRSLERDMDKARAHAGHIEEAGEVCVPDCLACCDPVAAVIRDLDEARNEAFKRGRELTTANQVREAAEAEITYLRNSIKTMGECSAEMEAAFTAKEDRLATMIAEGDDEAARLRTTFGITPNGRSLEEQLIDVLAAKEAQLADTTGCYIAERDKCVAKEAECAELHETILKMAGNDLKIAELVLEERVTKAMSEHYKLHEVFEETCATVATKERECAELSGALWQAINTSHHILTCACAMCVGIRGAWYREANTHHRTERTTK